MTIKLIYSPHTSKAAKHGFNYAIEIPKRRRRGGGRGVRTFYTIKVYRSIKTICQDRLGNPYQIDWQRPGKTRKWFLDDRCTFDRFYFKSDAARTLVLMCM